MIKMMKRKLFWLTAVALSVSALVRAEPTTPTQPVVPALPASQPVTPLADPSAASDAVAQPQVEAVPSRDVVLNFAKIAPAPGSIRLRGTDPTSQVEFGVRSDEVVSKALLNLEFIPSPALLPTESQVKVYLNDELMGVIPIAKEQLGQKTQVQMPIDPRYISDFNRVRLEFVGHYRIICENPANTTLWLDVSRGSALALTYQTLPLKNDLSHFPEPFFDSRDTRPLTLPMVFAAAPDASQQRSAAVLASWFGARAQWRGQNFPVLYNQLPDRHAIVFATNDKRPDFLRDYPAVKGPTVEMIGHPDNPYVKLLLVLGRNDDDLQTAVRGIAQGNILFRGESVEVEGVKTLAPRQPYDAPNWVRTDRPMTFSELQTYAGQLQSSGLVPSPINVTVNLPPDLYLIRSTGIDMDLKYRYTAPPADDSSRMSVSLNDQFIQAFPLTAQHEKGSVLMRLPLLQGLIDKGTEVTIPALRLGASNQLRFDFSYTNPMPGGSIDNCVTYQPVDNHVVIDGNSTIDFSGYRHFMAMPDLRAYANAGFPFSRLADLSQTTVVVGKSPRPAQLSALLNTLGAVGAQTGYPALQVKLTDDWASAKARNDDIMLIGTIPDALKDDSKINLLVQATESWVKVPLRQPALDTVMPDPADIKPDARTDIRSDGPMAAVIGFQSPFDDQRSVVALLADSPRGYELLNQALNDSGKRAAMFGSVAVIRESGVNSLRVGDVYYVGHLPWWERLWHAFAEHPVLLAILSVVSVVLFAWVLWRLLRLLSRRRLSADERK
ncbi:cellulose synthase subunit [Enterobacillus tribolii]|uniref:Cyclic di-GMP-binding protein n=2 Tax=Enterobacillus tribolii TaxID=1487935 RepID=A0A370QU94_9GAMM|nr:cellulose synthase subunit [Enterobacillus tribolii]